MSKSVPSELNESFLNMGLLATLVGTLGRVLGDRYVLYSCVNTQSCVMSRTNTSLTTFN